jgi:hypothetical protein
MLVAKAVFGKKRGLRYDECNTLKICGSAPVAWTWFQEDLAAIPFGVFKRKDCDGCFFDLVSG